MATCGVGAVQLKVLRRRGKPCVVLGAAQVLGVAKDGGTGLLQDIAAGLKGYAHPALFLTAPSSKLGRSLVARTDIAPGTTLLSLPVTSSLQVIENCTVEAPLPWSIQMALQLLDMRRRAQQRDQLHASPGGSPHATWLEALPPAHTFTLPITTFSEEQLSACQEEDTINVARGFRGMLQSAAEVLCDDHAALGANEGDLYWAVGLAHSRSFTTQDSAATITHTIAPGIDMANHSFEPSATVRFCHSPETCQGWEAADEVSVQPAGGNVTRVELLAGEKGIGKEEAVTINYGASHADDVFYLFYGFLPEREPPSPVVIFSNLAELANFACPEGAPNWVSTASQSREHDRLVVTADGFDQRAVDAVGKLLAHRGKDLRLADVMHLLADRCRQKLATYTTTIEEDRALLKQADASGGVTLSIRYRLRKKELLRGVVNNLQVLQTQTNDATGRSVLSERLETSL